MPGVISRPHRPHLISLPRFDLVVVVTLGIEGILSSIMCVAFAGGRPFRNAILRPL